MVSERRPEKLDAWLDAAESSEVAEIKNFAGALRRDYEAVAAALAYEWSSGQVEGQINRLKLIKRQMCTDGRALICCVNASWEPPDAVLLHRKRGRA